MERINQPPKNKGGRPKKDIVKDQVITLKCTRYDKATIVARAKSIHLTVSEYLLQIGKEGQIVSRAKILPKEVLILTGTLNHQAANLNQLAKKRNSLTDVLTPLDRADLLLLCIGIRELVALIRNYLQ